MEDLTTANPAVPTPYEERRSRRKKDMDENDLLTLAESVRLERSQRGAWLKEKLPGSPSSDSLQDISSVGTVSPISSGPASPLLGVVVPPANPAPVGPSPSDETTSEKGSLEEKEVRLAVSAAVKQVTESDLSPTSRRSPGVTVIASSPVEKFVPEIEPRPPGAEEQWMNDLIRENALENATLGMMSGGNDEEDDEADTPSTLTVAAKIKAFERAGGAVTTNRA